MQLRPEYASVAAAALRQQRRALASDNPKAFAQVYLASMCNKPFSRMHHELFEELATLHARRGSRVAVAAPRGHAKSTIVTLAYVLWALVCNKEPLVLVVSETTDQAKKLLEHVKRQIETNVLLRQDFPELAKADRITPWRQGSILLPNNCTLLSYASHQNLRGVRHGKHRPTLIIADDLEDKLQVASEEQRRKLTDWFNSTLLKAGTPETNVVVVGTVFHHDSLLANLMDPGKSPGWKGMRYQAVEQFSPKTELWERWSAIFRSQFANEPGHGPDAAAAFYREHEAEMLEGTRVLWPEQYSYVELMTTRMREGAFAFQAEFQNEPLDPDLCLFAHANLSYWDDDFPTVEKLLESFSVYNEQRGLFYGACDPSLGGNPLKGDFSAIVILFQPLGSETMYVVAADLARRTPNATIDRIIHYAKMYRFTNFGIEGNQFQEVMVENLRERARAACVPVPITSIKNRSGKQQRIAALESEVSQGRLIFARQHTVFMEQLRSFPLGKHDDGPDALEMAVYTARNANFTQVGCMFSGEVWYDSRFGGRPPPGF